jgi:hypothetical protein
VEGEIGRVFFRMIFGDYEIGWEGFESKIIGIIGDVDAEFITGEEKCAEIGEGGAC